MIKPEDKRIRRTKKLLRQALTRLMGQKDFQSITVTDVVREADINRGTFYVHYRDIYDLREKIENEMIGNFRAMIEDIRPDDLNSSMGPVLVRAVDYLEENREIVCALTGSSTQDSFGSKMMNVIEDCWMAALPNGTTEDIYIARFVATGLVGALGRWVRDPKTFSKKEIIALMVRILQPMFALYT